MLPAYLRALIFLLRGKTSAKSALYIFMLKQYVIMITVLYGPEAWALQASRVVALLESNKRLAIALSQLPSESSQGSSSGLKVCIQENYTLWLLLVLMP